MTIKRTLSIFLLCAMILSFTGGSITALTDEIQLSAIKEAVVGYLSEAAYMQYYYTERDLDRFTVANATNAEMRDILKKTANLDELLKENAITPTDGAASFSYDSADGLRKNLSIHKDTIAYYAHLNQNLKSQYRYLTPKYTIINIVANKELAIVDVREVVDFQYVELEQTSMMMTDYRVIMVKNLARWQILSVDCEDMIARSPSFDLQKTLTSVDEAFYMDDSASSSEETVALAKSPEQDIPDRGASRNYNASNAVNYALTYTSVSDDGTSLGASNYKNVNFKYGGEDCQRFVSQCIWAGFGGSNDLQSINNKLGMDTDGQHRWWGTKTQDCNEPSESASQFSWSACSYFKNYIDAVKSNSSESGVVCKTNEIRHYQNHILIGTGDQLVQSDFLGAALHVKGTKNSVDKKFGHAVIVTAVTGNLRSRIYFSAYNKCARNINLYSKYPADNNNTNNAIYVMVPQVLRNGNVSSGKYLGGDLKDQVARGTYETVTGRASSSVSQLTIKIYKPSASTPTYTFSAQNTSVISRGITFNQNGLWKVEVSSAGLPTHTFTIRVVPEEIPSY